MTRQADCAIARVRVHVFIVSAREGMQKLCRITRGSYEICKGLLCKNCNCQRRRVLPSVELLKRTGATGNNGLPAPYLERIMIMARNTNAAVARTPRAAITLAIGDKVPLELSGEALKLFETLKECEAEAREIKAAITAKCQNAGYVAESGGVLRFGRAAYSGEPTLYCFTGKAEKAAKPERKRVHLA